MSPPPKDLSFPEGNDAVVSKGPCEKCGSSDGFVTYADGHGYCFVCQHKTKATSGQTQPRKETRKVASGLLNPADYKDAWTPPSGRHLTAATIKRYGYFKALFNSKSVGVAPYYDQDGNLAVQKLRLPNKEFVVLKANDQSPEIGKCRLFGHHVWGDKNDKRVVVTEGEIDAMSVAQETDFTYPAVSLTSGAAGALKCMKANYLWLDRFEEIVLWFDDDEPGRKATDECAQLFAVGKVKIARCPK